MTGLGPKDNASDSGDSATAAVREVEAAIKANPELRGKTPPLRHGEWEDYERVLAENPELAQPVPSSGGARTGTSFYYSQDKWECSHSGEPVRTAIEREPVEGEKDGIDLATGQIHPSAILTNEIRGICPKCMEKWTGPSANKSDRGSSSRDLAALPPAYDQPPPAPSHGFDDDFDNHGPQRGRGMLDIDEGPGKGKYPVGGRPPSPPQHPGDEEDDDDFSERSVSPPGPERGPPRAAPPSHEPPRWGPPDNEDDDGPLTAPSRSPNQSPGGYGRPPSQRGGPQGYRQPAGGDDFDDFDEDEDDDRFFNTPPRGGLGRPPQGHGGPPPSGGYGGDPPPY